MVCPLDGQSTTLVQTISATTGWIIHGNFVHGPQMMPFNLEPATGQIVRFSHEIFLNLQFVLVHILAFFFT